ncbi:hypothetical protein FB567DRAFT_146200 [Paraphoma chrysanthemicola]|uniref:Uncharacterized protein n=1 Tax=Paraphoma chrysanthemicola TaxID=798071 RepID=A0A8K0VV39_9PLEO|nr:hypothetical protein FB567DRAFT_146200 [Paraphoma chrysanthemicola]
MSCNFSSNYEIGFGITYAAFETLIEVCPATYIRPDPGGAMMPWFLSLVLLLFHLPTCIIRAVRWESAQYMALGLAMLGITLTVQAYVSTALKAEEVLVWMPLTLVLDVGAMLQMVMLILEKHDERALKDEERPARPRRGVQVLWDAVKEWAVRIKGRMIGRREDGHGREDNAPQIQLVDHALLGRAQPDDPNAIEADRLHPDALRYAIVALVAFIFLILLLVLQLYGLYAAVIGRRQKDLRVNWCSPAFRDFAIAVTTGDCKKYQIINSSSNGIGCISLPGDQQRDWLLGTIIALSTALVCQVLDTALMLLTDSGTKWRAVKVQRPWLTMFGGVIMLVVLVVFGVFNAKDLPKGVTETVWIYRKEASRELGRVCRGKLNPPGLRGNMIGYMDGLFESWGRVYHGQ